MQNIIQFKSQVDINNEFEKWYQYLVELYGDDIDPNLKTILEHTFEAGFSQGTLINNEQVFYH